MMNKRIISIVTLIFVLFSSVAAFAAPDWTYDPKLEAIYGIDTSTKVEVEEENDEDVVQQLLGHLGLIGAQDSLDDEADINDFVNAMCDISSLTSSDFRSWAQEQTGVDFGTGKVTFAQAAACGVLLIGYETYGQAIGGYPGGYMQAAFDKDLFTGLKPVYNQAMLVRELNQFLYNLLLVPTKAYVLEENVSKYGETDDCLLVRRYGLTQKIGILNAVGMTNIYGISTLESNEAELDRIRYKTDNAAGIGKYIGHNVAAYVDENTNTMLLAVPHESAAVEFTDADVEEYQANRFVLEDAKVKYNNSTRIMLNGLYYGTVENGIPELNSSSVVTAIDNTDDGTADVLIIWNYKHFVVNSDVGSRGTIGFGYGAKYDGKTSIVASVDDGGWDELEILKNGATAKATDILAGDVVSIASAKDGSGQTKLRVVASDKFVSGEIETIANDTQGLVITVNGKDYVVSEDYKTACNYPAGGINGVLVPTIGQTVKLHLSKDGTVAGISETEISYKWAYLQAVDAGDSFKKDNSKLRIFDGDEAKFLELTLADKVTYHKNPTTTLKTTPYEVAADLLAPRKADAEADIRQMICYTANNDGVITELWATYDNRNGTPGEYDYPCTMDYNPAGWFYHRKFMSSGYFTKTEKIMIVPGKEDALNDDLYRMTTASNYKTAPYSVDASKTTIYGSDDNKMYDLLLITESSGEAMGNEAPAYFVEKVSNIVKDDTNAVRITGYDKNGNGAQIDIEDPELLSYDKEEAWTKGVKAKDLKPGDVIAVQMDGVGKWAKQFKILHRAADTEGYFYRTGTGAAGAVESTEYVGAYYGYVKVTKLTTYTDMGSKPFTLMNYTDGSADMSNFILSDYVNAKVMIYDSETCKYTKGSHADISVDSNAFIYRSWAGIYLVVIYE